MKRARASRVGPREEAFMREALAQAEQARGRTHPNPIVGALVVKGSRVLGRGHHARAGAAHAEVVALQDAGASADGADLFVTLEPCNHHGRTPPCTAAVLAAGIKRVFVGTRDPNRDVVGGGAARLRRAGVEVIVGVLEDECDHANEQWSRFITTGRPWVVLKAAVTLDGMLATASGDSRWVTGEPSRRRVHLLRNDLDAVLVGVNTVLADDPQLTVRLERPRKMLGTQTISNLPTRDPLRIVVDARGRTPTSARMLREPGSAATIVATTVAAPLAKRRALTRAGAELLLCKTERNGRVDLRNLLRQLGARGVTSILVEGGAAIHGSFLRARLWDELHLFVAPKLAGQGARSWAGFAGPRSMADALKLQMVSVDASTCAPDLWLRARPV